MKLRTATEDARRWAELAILDPWAVVEASMEERAIRALAIAYQVDAEKLLRLYRKRLRAEGWAIRRDLEQALHDGDDPTEGDE